jgi:hypothetical protein
MDEDLAAQNKRISDNIREFGWHCLHVFPTEDSHGKFSYSIGFGESYGSPEVLIFGFEREKAHDLLNACAEMLQDGHTIRNSVENPNVLKGSYNVVFRPVRSTCFGEYLGTALRYYQDRPFGAVVMFLPDREHRFPWQSGYDYISADESLAIV